MSELGRAATLCADEAHQCDDRTQLDHGREGDRAAQGGLGVLEEDARPGDREGNESADGQPDPRDRGHDADLVAVGREHERDHGRADRVEDEERVDRRNRPQSAFELLQMDAALEQHQGDCGEAPAVARPRRHLTSIVPCMYGWTAHT